MHAAKAALASVLNSFFMVKTPSFFLNFAHKGTFLYYYDNTIVQQLQEVFGKNGRFKNRESRNDCATAVIPAFNFHGKGRGGKQHLAAVVFARKVC